MTILERIKIIEDYLHSILDGVRNSDQNTWNMSVRDAAQTIQKDWPDGDHQE